MITEIVTYAPAIRGKPFKKFIKSLLGRVISSKDQLKRLTGKSEMSMFEVAFTHSTAESKTNYETLEFIGDGFVNTSVIQYLPKRFPHILIKGRKLSTAAKAGVYTQMKNNLISEKALSARAEELGYWAYIDASDYQKSTKKIKLLEDIFEAFIGALVQNIEKHFGIGAAFAVVYKFMEQILDKIEVPIEYESLKTSKTRLKELFDTLKWGVRGAKLEFRQVEGRTTTQKLGMGAVGRVPTRGHTWDDIVGDDVDPSWYRSEVISIGRSFQKKDAESKAATKALAFLKKKGLFREDEYDHEDEYYYEVEA